MEKGSLQDILRAKQTVFTFKDLILLWQGVDFDNAKSRVNYYVKTGALYPIRRGIYAKDKNYDRLELATKIFTPAYISFETVLGSAGVTFQYYSQIFVATYQSLERIVDGQKISYRRLKSPLLTNSNGIENLENYAIASPERAFLDLLYLSDDYHFDNLATLNWQKVEEILPIYGENKRMARQVNQFREALKEDH
ncbi:MAG: hypothetical protein VB013_10485 [Anaerolineaceae bacterium]|nr:hypothetical protein [Anaerolineaceae bacterium]